MVKFKKVKEEFSVDSTTDVRVAACFSLSDGNCDTPVLRRSSVIGYVVLTILPLQRFLNGLSRFFPN
jgi:hypothetical protein